MHVFGISGVVGGALWGLQAAHVAPSGPLKIATRHLAKTIVKHVVFGHFGLPQGSKHEEITHFRVVPR